MGLWLEIKVYVMADTAHYFLLSSPIFFLPATEWPPAPPYNTHSHTHTHTHRVIEDQGRWLPSWRQWFPAPMQLQVVTRLSYRDRKVSGSNMGKSWVTSSKRSYWHCPWAGMQMWGWRWGQDVREVFKMSWLIMHNPSLSLDGNYSVF